jgi:peptide/nickel transport system substrate-binding protein
VRLIKAGHVGALTVAAVGALVLSGCSGGSSSTSGAKSGSFIVGAGDVDNLDPVQFKSDAAYTADANMYAPLLVQQYTPKNGYLQGTDKFSPGLATSTSTSADGKTVTFKLRSGIKFADGHPITADDVAYSLQRSVSDAGYTSALAPYMGIGSPSAISAVDPTTVQITLAHPSALLQRFLAFQTFGVLQKSQADAHKGSKGWATDYFTRNATPSGPYQISSWQQGQQLVLKKNPNYYDAASVKATSVTIQNMPNPNQRYLALQNGSIDVALGLPPTLVAQAEKDPSLVVYKMPTSAITYLGMNNKDPVLRNKLVRQAISYAIPYGALRQQVMHGFAQSADGPVPAGMATSLDTTGKTDPYPTDPAKAKALLAQAGVHGLHLTLTVEASDATAVQSATFIQSALAQAGIKLNINQLTDADYATKLNSKQLQMFINLWYSWGEDPFYQMNFLLHSGVPTNYTGYSNAKVDADIGKGVLATDAQTRTALSQDAQRQVIADAPWAFLYTSDVLIVARKGISGITRPDDNYLRFAYLTRK